MAMMTYKAFCADVNENPILAQSDETVQSAVYDWFKYRFIGFEDTDKFLDILQRNVSINYPIYQQKLRIEPGVSNYDWLVSVYRERQVKSTGTTGNKRTHGDDSITHGATVTTTPSGTETVEQIGSETHTKTGGHTETDVEGTHTVERVDGVHTTLTAPKVQTVTSEDGGDNAWSGDSSIQAQLPLSKSYSTMIEPDDTDTDSKQYYKKAYQHMPALDWETATAQAQSGHREYHDTDHKTTTSYIYEDGVDGDLVTTQGDSSNPDTEKREGDITNPDTKEMVYNDEKDTIEFDGRKTQTSFTDRKTVVENGGTDTNAYGDIEDTGSHSSTDREQMTGRNEDPATILARATAFIEQSSAFMWFKEQIDSCFYPGFYTDTDYDGNEEGSALI